MKMVSAGAGLGFGVKDYRVVFVFENGKVLEDFLNSGWGGTAQADAAAKTEKSGGVLSSFLAARKEPQLRNPALQTSDQIENTDTRARHWRKKVYY